MRAIDADAFKEYITDACEDMKHLFNDGGAVAKLITESFCKDIDEQPTIQPEIVRCKDCKYARLTDDGSCKYCDIWFPDEAEYMDGDYYCASAERKSDG